MVKSFVSSGGGGCLVAFFFEKETEIWSVDIVWFNNEYGYIFFSHNALVLLNVSLLHCASHVLNICAIESLFW